MSAALTTDETTDMIQARMNQQRALIQKQFAGPELKVADPMSSESSADAQAATEGVMHPTAPREPRSFLMRFLLGNPHLMQRAVVLGATTLLGARYSSWAIKIVGLLLAARAKR